MRAVDTNGRTGVRRLWAKVRRVWIVAGSIAFVIFTTWSLWAYQATPAARAALRGTDAITVARGDGYWVFRPKAHVARSGLLFFPGALVEALEDHQ